MKEWRLVVLLCTALLFVPVRPQEKWSRPETADKRVDDWVPITASCPSCRKNIEPSESSSVDEIGSLLNPPALPAGGARSLFKYNSQQNQFKRAPANEPFEGTPPPQFAQSQQQQQFFSHQPFPKLSQPVHFPLPFFGQQNPFQNRFQPSFQPQFTFLPQQQPQPQPIAKENKVTFPETPFNQQSNKGMVQLVYVPIEALQRQKPRFQSDRPVSQQSTLDTKQPASFDSDKLRFQRPPLTVEQTKSRFQTGQEPGRFQAPPQTFVPETNRFPPSPPSPPSFIPDSGRFPSPPAEQNAGRFSPPQSTFEQGVNTFTPPQPAFEQNTGNFIPPSQIFNPGKPAFTTQTKDSRPEFLPQNEQSTSPLSFQFSEDARNPPTNFFQFHNRFQKPQTQEDKLKETQPQVQQNFVPNFEDSSKESSQNVVPAFESRPPSKEVPQNVIPNFSIEKPRTEQPASFVPSNNEQPLRSKQQLPSNFQERPSQETEQQTFVSNFEFRPRPENQEFIPNFQDTRPTQTPIPQTFSPGFEDIRPRPRPKIQTSTFPTPPQMFSSPNSIEETFTSTTYPPAHQPPLSVYMEKRLDNKVNEVLTILKDAKTIPVLDTIGDRSPKVFVGPSDLDAPRGYVKFELPYLSSLDITKIETMVDSLPFFVAPLNFKPPIGYSKIPFPPPHIGSVVVSSRSPVSAEATSTEFVPFTLTPQLPTEVNSLKPFSSTQREFSSTERVKPSTTSSSPAKRNRQRKPIHRGSLTSFSTTTPLSDITESQRDQFTTPSELPRLPENVHSTIQQQFVANTPTPITHQFSDIPKQSTQQQQQAVFESSPTPTQQFDTNPPQYFTEQQFSDPAPQLNQPQFFDDQQQHQSFDQSQQNQQTFLENQPQPAQQEFIGNVPQFVTEETLKAQSVPDVSTQEPFQQQFLPSTTEKPVHKNFQSVQPLSEFNPQRNQVLQPSTTEQVQTASPISQTQSDEPVAPLTTGLPKNRQRLSYYDKVILSSTEAPTESTSVQNTIETSEKPRERQKLRPRQRLTTTRRPTTESKPSEENSEHLTESTSTQRYNPLRRRRPITTTTSTEASEPITRSSFRSRTTQANRPEFVRSRSRRPLTTTTTTTTTTEVPRTEQYENNNDVQENGKDEQKKIEEAASFWNEPVTIQQSHGYELGSYTSEGSNFSNGEPPSDEVVTKEKYNDKKAHDPNNEKKTPGRRGHWVRVKVKKPQDSLDTAESQNSLGPLSANAIREMVTKPTAPAEYGSSSLTTSELITTTTTTTTTTLPPSSSESTVFTTAGPLPTTTMMPEYTMEGVTDYHPAETTLNLSSSTGTPTKNVDDEQDEAFQRNLADMLAKFISNPQQDQHQTQETSMAPTIVEEITSERLDEVDMDTTVPPPTSVTEIINSDPVTSTTTKVSMETEICYKGRCVKSEKNKNITDLLPEP